MHRVFQPGDMVFGHCITWCATLTHFAALWGVAMSVARTKKDLDRFQFRISISMPCQMTKAPVIQTSRNQVRHLRHACTLSYLSQDSQNASHCDHVQLFQSPLQPRHSWCMLNNQFCPSSGCLGWSVFAVQKLLLTWELSLLWHHPCDAAPPLQFQ